MGFTQLIGVKKSNQQNKESFLNVNIPQVIFFQGKRITGKGVAREKCIETFYDNGFTCFDAWAARNNENWFYGFNNNCNAKWRYVMKLLNQLSTQNDWVMTRKDLMVIMDTFNDEMFDFYINELIYSKWIRTKNEKIQMTELGWKTMNDEPLHCTCDKAYPILAMVPDYVEISNESIANFNKQYYWDYHEYKKDFLARKVHDILPKNTNFWKVEKPQSTYKDILKVIRIPIPTPKKKEAFIDGFTKALLLARSEHRILIQNPAMFNGDDKFKALAAEINELHEIMKIHFKPLTEEEVGKPRHQWNPYQLSHEKIVMGLGELKTIAPTHQMSGEKQSTETKRALFDKIGEWTHQPRWLVGDYQNPEDLFSGVRYQADYICIKRASKNILGDAFSWLFADIEDQRRIAYHKLGISDDMLDNAPWLIDPMIHMKVNKKFIRVQNLPDDTTIVTDIDNSWYYQQIGQNRHHHKHRIDNFDVIFKLDIKLVDEKGNVKTGEELLEETEEDDEKKTTKTKGKSHQELMERIDYMVESQHKSFPEIAEELTPKEVWEKLSDKDKKKTTKSLWGKYDYWKDSTRKDNINKTFGKTT